MTTTDKLTDEQWLIQHLEDDAEACSAVNGSKDITTKDARRAEVTVKRLIRERDDARRASQAATAPSDKLREAFIAGAQAIHAEWLRANEAGESPPRGDPEFGEAADDYCATMTPAPAQEGGE